MPHDALTQKTLSVAGLRWRVGKRHVNSIPFPMGLLPHNLPPSPHRMLNTIAIFLTITALLTYVNHRFMKLPTTIGVMTAALLMSLGLVGLNTLGLAEDLLALEVSLLHSVDFSEVLMQGMLSMLLFAGALHINLGELKAYRWQVASLAVVSTLLSTAAVGFGLWWALPWLGLSLPLMYCLLFGALISPTDPIAVMGILKSARAPHELELVIAGESLFNDGVGVVVFTLLLGMLASGVAPTLAQGGEVLLHEVGGGVLLGLVLGYVCFRLLKSVDNYQLEVLLTLALAQAKGRLSETDEQAHLKAMRHLPAALQAVLALEPQLISWAEDFAKKENALFLGRGLHYPIALEGALKLKEITYIHAEAYAAGELKHGPLALVTSEMPVVAVAPNDTLLEKLKSNLHEVRARGGVLYVLADADSRIESGEGMHVIRMPEHYGALSPLLHVVPLQLLAYHTACARGMDVDKPRNLAKSVTVE